MSTPATTTQIKPRVLTFLGRIQKHVTPDSEAHYMLSELMDELSSGRVSITMEVVTHRPSPVPDYNPDTDGDYSRWLASNNID